MAFIPKEWQFVEEQVRTSVDMSWGSAGVIDFKDLDGDKYDYKAIIYLTDQVVCGRINSDAGSSYRVYNMGADESAISDNGADSETYLAYYGNYSLIANYCGFGIDEFLGKSGNERVINRTFMGNYTGHRFTCKEANRWKNTADKITSIQYYNVNGTTATTATIRLYKRNKNWNQSEWELIEKKTLAGVDCSAGLLFSGLNGDKDEEYKIDSSLISNSATEASISVLMNSDNTAGNYKNKYITLANSTLSSAVGDWQSWFTNLNNTNRAQNEMIIKAKSGAYRVIRHYGSYIGAGADCAIDQTWWENSADNIENIKLTFSRSDLITGDICLYRKKKKPTYQSNWEEIARYDIDGDWTNGNITENLKGDIDLMYKIETVMYSKTAGQGTLLHLNALNADVGANACYIEELYGYDGSIEAWGGTWNYWSAGVDSVYPSYMETIIYPKSGKYRPMLIFESSRYNNSAYYNYLGGVWWLNTADVIMSILHKPTTWDAPTDKSVKGTIKISKWRD